MAGKRLALLIANANYQHLELQKLNAPQNDVQALQSLLSRPEIGHYESEILIDGSKGQIERAINRMLTNGEREDTVLIFFAGHGIKHENGKLYFAAVDTEPEFLGGTAVSAAWLTDEMQNSKTGRQIILLDCCFGGAFARGNIWRGGVEIESGKALEVPDLASEGRGQVVITSADAMQFALEGDLLKGEPPASYFVSALKAGLETGDADRSPQDGRITIDELVSYLTKKVKELGSPQRPSKWIFGAVGGDLLFAYNPLVKARSKARRPQKGEQARRAIDKATKEQPWQNSLGMKFVPVASTRVLFGIWDTRVEDFRAFIDSCGYDATGEMWSLGKDGWKTRSKTWEEPGFKQGSADPVVGVSWEDAKAFCEWLTRSERGSGALPENMHYRLPTDEEWSIAVGLDSEPGNSPEEKWNVILRSDSWWKDSKIILYPWGTKWPPPSGVGNYRGKESRIGDEPKDWPVIKSYDDGYPRTSPAGSFAANKHGLYDMGGNVWQWCEDWYNFQNRHRVLRGASWFDGGSDNLLSSFRFYDTPGTRSARVGFRCVVAGSVRGKGAVRFYSSNL
jgi:formylglycine-generating enzyme required for sulfatase activity